MKPILLNIVIIFTLIQGIIACAKFRRDGNFQVCIDSWLKGFIRQIGVHVQLSLG
ncbi:MAG: hypothetical protein HC936_00385 [Leptolyngbyaceae cyanobacterium SU_3_3]|nr:hypothetical protein [Leptolyngbyaceae cyanobacterium SU_3_3]